MLVRAPCATLNQLLERSRAHAESTCAGLKEVMALKCEADFWGADSGLGRVGSFCLGFLPGGRASRRNPVMKLRRNVVKDMLQAVGRKMMRRPEVFRFIFVFLMPGRR